MIRHREMMRDELDVVLGWARAEGWNPGLDDAEAFYSADPNGFFLAEDDGEPVAAISVVNHSDEFAFLGLYICRPTHRGRGIGYDLWQHSLTHAGNRTVGLDGVPDQQDNYVKSGFIHAGATTRYSGKITGSAHDRIREAAKADIPGLIALEARASGLHKPAFLSAWFRNSGHRMTFLLEGDRRQVGGIATVRTCQSGAKVGPLVASDRSNALALLHHAATEFGEDLIIDVPSTSPELERICRAKGLSPGFHTARMYRGSARIPSADFYAVATLELG